MDEVRAGRGDRAGAPSARAASTSSSHVLIAASCGVDRAASRRPARRSSRCFRVQSRGPSYTELADFGLCFMNDFILTSVEAVKHNGQYEQALHREARPDHRCARGGQLSIRATVRMTGAAKNTDHEAARGPRARRAPSTRTATLRDLPCKTHPVRRDLGLLLRQAEERPRGTQGHLRLRRRVDVDRDLRRHEARPVLARRASARLTTPGCSWRDLAGPAGQPRPAHHGRATSAYLDRRRASPSGARSTTRSCTRSTGRAERRGHERRYSPADLHRHRRSQVICAATPTRRRSPRATWSARTSRCGWGCAASRA